MEGGGEHGPCQILFGAFTMFVQFKRYIFFVSTGCRMSHTNDQATIQILPEPKENLRFSSIMNVIFIILCQKTVSLPTSGKKKTCVLYFHSEQPLMLAVHYQKATSELYLAPFPTWLQQQDQTKAICLAAEAHSSAGQGSLLSTTGCTKDPLTTSLQ